MTVHKKTKFHLALALAAGIFGQGAALAAGPNPEEVTALKKLGSQGFVIYKKTHSGKSMFTGPGDVWRYDLNPDCKVEPRKIISNAVGVTLSGDGALVGYTVSNDTTGKNVDIWVAHSDGSHPRKLTKAPMPYVTQLKFDLGSHRMVFSSAPTTGRPEIWASRDIWVIDLQGKAQKVMTTGSVNPPYFDYLDINKNSIGYRIRGKYSYTTEMADGVTKDFLQVQNASLPQYETAGLGQLCAITFSPTGDTIAINTTPHTSMQLFKRTARDGKNWTSFKTVNNFSFVTSGFRWSNKGNWVVMREEKLNLDMYAVNALTGDKVRLSFDGSPDQGNYNGQLHIGPTAAAPSVGLHMGAPKARRNGLVQSRYQGFDVLGSATGRGMIYNSGEGRLEIGRNR